MSHRRARRNRARARLLLALVRARDLWTRHHGSHPLKEEMVNTWACRGTGSCGYQLNWLSHNQWWRCCEKDETVIPKAKRPWERRAVETHSSSSELAKAKGAVAKLEAACAADPKKQRLEQVESEKASHLICKRNSRPLVKSVTGTGSKWNWSMRKSEKNKKWPTGAPRVCGTR